jgi:hypothetical protein
MDTFIGKVDHLYGVTTVNGGNMSDYFIKKKHKSVDTAPEESCIDQQKEQVGSEVGDNDYGAEIVTKKKQKHKNTVRSDSQVKKGAGQETKENELKLNDGSARGDEKTQSEHYCEKSVYNLQEKSSSFMQEFTKKRKQKENQDMAGKEVGQEIGGNDKNDSANCFNYKRKKIKLEQVAKEYLLKEEKITKQGGTISVKESYSEKDTKTSETENNHVKSKKKRKEKDTECTDALGNEGEADRNEITLMNGDNRSCLNCRKKKVKVKMEDDITEQGKNVSAFDISVSEIYYPSRNKHGKNSLQGNDESVDYQDAAVTDNLVLRKDSSRKLKHCWKSVDRVTEVDHSEKKDHKFVEEEPRKHMIKKTKKRKHSKDEKTPEIQELELMRYNVRESEAVSCDRKNCEELSVTSATNVFVNCRNKGKKRKGKILNKNCAYVELECEKDEMIQEQEDTETNEQKSKTAVHTTKTQNVEDLKEARNNPKQDFCNSNVQNSVGANIEVTDIEKIDISRRNMRPSVFAQLVEPSLIRFRGSNLQKIPGYGNY